MKKHYYANHAKQLKRQNQYYKTNKKRINKNAATKRNTLIGRLQHDYSHMKDRCLNKKDATYKLYGSRGTRCLFSVDTFIRHVIDDLKVVNINQIKGMSIQLIDETGNFKPGNIQFVTYSERGAGMRMQIKKTSSRHKGVHLTKAGKYMTRIGYQNKRIYCGVFSSEDAAAECYNTKAIELYGECARLNII